MNISTEQLLVAWLVCVCVCVWVGGCACVHVGVGGRVWMRVSSGLNITILRQSYKDFFSFQGVSNSFSV